jgi:hypothetical protein
MATIQISKIQMRRGPASDLPNPSLDDGEFGFTTDTGRLFIGQTTPTEGQPNYDRVVFPWQNIEVFTEDTPNSTLQPMFADNQYGFITAAPMIVTGSFITLQVYNSSNVAENFYVDLDGFGANAVVYYFIFDASNNPIRLGRLTVLWNTGFTGGPLCTDDAEVLMADYTDIAWQATYVSSLTNQHIVLQYTNSTGGPATVYFRIDRPAQIP